MSQASFDIIKERVNFVLSYSGFSGRAVVECETAQEVWAALGKASFGATYSVTSPTGKDTSQFTPF